MTQSDDFIPENPIPDTLPTSRALYDTAAQIKRDTMEDPLEGMSYVLAAIMQSLLELEGVVRGVDVSDI